MGASIGPVTAKKAQFPTNLTKLNKKQFDIVAERLWYAYESYGFETPKQFIRLRHTFTNEPRMSMLKWWEWVTVYDTISDCKTTIRTGHVLSFNVLTVSSIPPIPSHITYQSFQSFPTGRDNGQLTQSMRIGGWKGDSRVCRDTWDFHSLQSY